MYTAEQHLGFFFYLSPRNCKVQFDQNYSGSNQPAYENSDSPIYQMGNAIVLDLSQWVVRKRPPPSNDQILYKVENTFSN